jgi:RHS repeat-associated protein
MTYFHVDHQGTPIARSDAWGVVFERTRRGSFGEPLAGPLKNGPGYTGHMEDPGTGLVYMQQRYYDPAIARFLSVDPVGPLADPTNHFGRYHYANNNPDKYVDPDGRFGVVGALIGGGIEIGVQVAVQGKSISQIDKTDVIVAMAVGSVTGGLGGKLATTAARGQIASSVAVRETAKAGAAANAIGSGAASMANGELPSASAMGVAAAAGGIGSFAGAKLGNAPTEKLERMAQSPIGEASGIGGHVANATRAVAIGRSTEVSISAGQVMIDASASALHKKAEKEIHR